MFRRRWFLLPMLLIAVAGAVTGGVVMAQGGGTGGDRITDRAAEILGIDPGDLRSALEQARSDVTSDRLEQQIAKALEDGRITEEEASAIRTWLDGRPASFSKLGASIVPNGPGNPHVPGRARVGVAPRHFGGGAGLGSLSQEDAAAIQEWLDAFPESLGGLGINDAIAFMKTQIERTQAGEEPFPMSLDGLVQAGILTADQVDALRAWVESRPEAAAHLGAGGPGMLRFFQQGGADDLIRAMRERIKQFGLNPGRDDLRALQDFGDLFKFDGNGNGSFEFRFGPRGRRFEFRFPDHPGAGDNGQEPETAPTPEPSA